jgi:hypothetical protein
MSRWAAAFYAVERADSADRPDTMAPPGPQTVNTVECVPSKDAAGKAARPAPTIYSVKTGNTVTGSEGRQITPALPSAGPKPSVDAAALLRQLRDVLSCRVRLEGDLVTIGPTHRCPPEFVEAAMAVVGDLAAILRAEDNERLGSSL